jgi:capsular exopolysaccharide synthesis family protein
MSGAGHSGADTALSEAWVTLRKRKYLIALFALAGMAYGTYKGSTQLRLYDSYGTIEIRSGSANEYRIGSTTSTEGSSRIPTQVAILKSDSLLLAVARDLNLANNPDFMGGGPNAPYRNIDDPVIRQDVLASMQGAVSVAAVTKTDLIRISCSTLNPKLSADIINKLVREYIQHSFQSRQDATKRVSDFFADQLGDLKKDVQHSQEQIIDLQKSMGVLGFDPSLNQVTANLADLNRAANAAEVARIDAETRYRVLAGLDRNAINQPLDPGRVSAAVTSLRSQLESARANLAQLSATLGPNHPQVLGVRDQIATLTRELGEEQDRVLADAKEAYVAAQAQEDQTKAALEARKTQAFQLRDDLVAYTLQQRDFDSNRTLYEGLLQRLRTAGVQAGLESTEIDIVDVAVPAIAPTLQPRSTMIVINTMVMLIAGLIVAFVLDSLDTGLRSVAEVESVSGLPTLALIPRNRRSGPENAALSAALRNLNVLSNPKSQFAESFRALRTSLLLSVAGAEPKTILLTSATPSEGKTTVSMNLACVLAQRDVRVLLIDADLRRPTVHHRFGLNGNIGLTSLLTGTVSFEEAVQTIQEIPMLDVLVSGPVPPFPTEMLSSETMRQLLERCRGIYTHIVMDSPPLLSVTDSVVLARDADAVVLIVRSGKSSKHALRRSRDLLQRSGSRITGIALNAIDLNSPEYYAYYGYYGYSGYASEGVDSKGWESRSGEGRTHDRRTHGDRE